MHSHRLQPTPAPTDTNESTAALILGASRRDLLKVMSWASGAMVLGLPTLTQSAVTHEHDWDWLIGNWDVFHSRLKDRLAGSTDWQEFAGKSAFWTTMGGLGNMDDNSLELPAGSYRGLSIRAFDSKSGKWAIWWVDGRNPTYIEPPVLGGFAGDTGTFSGRDTFKGTPIVMRFRWHEPRSKRPWWDQAFSTDDGKTWEINWRNYFTRTATEATSLPAVADAPQDFEFLLGSWRVRHRRLKERLVGSTDWQTFDGTLVNRRVLGGHGNVGDNVFNSPDGIVRGMGIRAFDRDKREWLSWWLDGRDPAVINSPLRGSFKDGVGSFVGDDTLNGHAIKTRVLWSQITPRSARWEQASSNDGGKTWEPNWISDFERQG